MIKIGLSAKAPDFVALVRHLKSHPDVEIVWITNAGRQAVVSNLFPELTGEYDGKFAEDEDFDAIDLYIGPWTPEIDTHPDVKAIVFGTADGTTAVESGLAEFNRKALVRGARVAVVPELTEILGALALMPLARNLMLTSSITGAILLPETETRYAETAIGPLGEARFVQLRRILTSLQTSFAAPIRLLGFTTADDVAMATLEVDCRLGVSDVAKLYHNFYDDHRHVTILEDPIHDVCAAMVRGTYKAVVSLNSDGSTLTVTAAVDSRRRTGAGAALHLLNLLFGLDELTGFKY